MDQAQCHADLQCTVFTLTQPTGQQVLIILPIRKQVPTSTFFTRGLLYQGTKILPLLIARTIIPTRIALLIPRMDKRTSQPRQG